MNLNLLITRFAHGSGGKFLSTVIQSHEQIQHWSSQMQNTKSSDQYPELLEYYMIRSFPKDHRSHMSMEPICPYDTELWSSTYHRGENVTRNKLVDYYSDNKDKYLMDGCNQNLITNLIFNKPQLPKFCAGSKTVTILIDNRRSLRWLRKTLWSKHFLEAEGKIIYAPDHPLYCSMKSLPTILKFKNQSEFPISEKFSLMKKHLYRNTIIEKFQDPSNFKEIDDQLEINNYNIPLSSFFRFDDFVFHMDKMMEQFAMLPMKKDLVKIMFDTWNRVQIPY